MSILKRREKLMIRPKDSTEDTHRAGFEPVASISRDFGASLGWPCQPRANAACSPRVSAVVDIVDLRVEYPSRDWRGKTKVAVNGLNLKVEQGEVFGFLGPNGAGKTTTMNVLLGFVNASSGSASIFGVDVRQPIARQRIGYLPELTYYYKFLNTEELLRFYAKIFKIEKAERERRIDSVLKLVGPRTHANV